MMVISCKDDRPVNLGLAESGSALSNHHIVKTYEAHGSGDSEMASGHQVIYSESKTTHGTPIGCKFEHPTFDENKNFFSFEYSDSENSQVRLGDKVNMLKKVDEYRIDFSERRGEGLSIRVYPNGQGTAKGSLRVLKDKELLKYGQVTFDLSCTAKVREQKDPNAVWIDVYCKKDSQIFEGEFYFPKTDPSVEKSN